MEYLDGSDNAGQDRNGDRKPVQAGFSWSLSGSGTRLPVSEAIAPLPMVNSAFARENPAGSAIFRAGKRHGNKRLHH
ncbi:hypothetical protein CO651_26185 [Rhizobium phaseoli]|nr:hypothetical protein CO651_26185 [Rhizobium phaseoli]